MQVEGRSFDFWFTLRFETSFAKVLLFPILMTIIRNYLVSADLTVLIQRLSEGWHSKIPLLVEAVKSLLEEQNLGVRKAMSEVSHRLFILYCCCSYFLLIFK